MHLLVIEDEQWFGLILRRALAADRHVVDVAPDGGTGLAMTLNGSYDLIILDLGLPDIDGLEVCRRLRAAHVAVPILMLTARGETDDRVTGLDAGADDYICKPFALSELLARIRALLRRPFALHDESMLRLADLTLDPASHRAFRDGRAIDLRMREYALLEYLLRHKGQILTREQILKNVWTYDYGGGTKIVDTYMYYLRHKIDTGARQPLLHTVRGSGYILREE